ncbi:phospholipase D-like domain-containing protein, partial [Rhizobiaceae sp. 2RAB30]
VDVAVLTNSLAATDVAAVHGAYAKYRTRLLQGGVRLYELRPRAKNLELQVIGSKGASLHTKAFTVDGRLGFIGSFNFD